MIAFQIKKPLGLPTQVQEQTHPSSCENTIPLHLPIPPPAHRLPSSNSEPLSPILGLESPELLSFHFRVSLRNPRPIEETYTRQEENAADRLSKLVSTYEQVLHHIESRYTKNLSKDAIKANDTWWNETNTKLETTKKLLLLLKKND